ncbi:hypothetical protein J8L88_18430 [Aquimarina sp. MMG015]|uniref:leucine-rich repeat domain-containing protein n=1 Tax=Aquimarina sp. MMG015 TaxID=2822689 RepID=UPI001B3A317F|nr:leucine-rich repeat domain-containing protein [Aquimarina sp. MMG015]MBQ4804847.1 hypothetical protein [Aquimarina sp. MMG015]
MNEKFPIYKFKLDETVYSVLNETNFKDLSYHMKDNELYNLLIDGRFWKAKSLPNMEKFNFINELKVIWTEIDDISPIQSCTDVRILTLDNGDKTKIDFNSFPNLEKLFSWSRKNIKNVWNIKGIKDLALAGLKKQDFVDGYALDSIEKLRLVKTPVEDLSFIKRAQNLKRLDLRSMSKLENIDFLNSLKNLEYLFLEANKVRDFKVVSKLTKLKTCILKSKNAIIDTNDFLTLNTLEKITLNGNEHLRTISREINEILKL